MGQTVVELTLPDAVVHSLAVRKSELGGYLKKTMAVELYREGRLSLGKAKELAGFSNKWDMLMLLSERGVPLNYTAEDAVCDAEMLDRICP